MSLKIIGIFLLLLFASNLFLLQEGLWLYQDQSSWVKNFVEAFTLINSQFHSYSNYFYYTGYDQGIFTFNNLTFYSFIFIPFYFLGSSGSQIFLSLFSYVLAFISFYAFISLFVKDTRLRFILTFLYVFNPLMYSFRGVGLMYSVVPLFIYSFYKFYNEKHNYHKYLLLNIFATSLWVGGVRFIQLYAFLIIPYLIYLQFIQKRSQVYIKKILYFLVINIITFSPLLYSFFIQFFQKSTGIFNFGTVFNNFVIRGNFYDMFNPFQSLNINLYDHKLYVLSGISLFIVFLILVIKYQEKNKSRFVIFNLALMLFGLTLFELGFIAGRDFYPVLIKLLPFLTNAPFYGLYIAYLPFIVLLGIIGVKNVRAIFIFSSIFIAIALLPLLNLNNFIFQKYSIDKIPRTYYEYFIKPYHGIPESTAYIPHICWRASYMQEANTPTQCINFGIRYSPINYNNPRIISGDEYVLNQKIINNVNLDNFRVTHNLKNIIVANDLVEEIDAGPLFSSDVIENTKQLNDKLKNNRLLKLKDNENFNHFVYKDKDDYDFFIYSPQEIVVKKELDTIFDNSLLLSKRPVVILGEEKKLKSNTAKQNVKITYKTSPANSTKYYLKISNVNKKEPFLIQFGQSFKPGWKLIWVSREEFEQRKCINDIDRFPITNNTRCQYENIFFDTSDIFLSGRKSVPEINHFRGNYISNLWLINPADLPMETDADRDLYAVILYSNQIYLTISIIIAFTSIGLLIVLTIYEEAKHIIYKKLK